jgi:hypothetical protein
VAVAAAGERIEVMERENREAKQAIEIFRTAAAPVAHAAPCRARCTIELSADEPCGMPLHRVAAP